MENSTSKPDEESNSIINPICIILVKNGSKGDRLLFRYPFIQIGKEGEKITSDSKMNDPTETKTTSPTSTSGAKSSPEGLTRATSTESVDAASTEKKCPQLITSRLKRRSLTKANSIPQYSRISNPYAIFNTTTNDLFENPGNVPMKDSENPIDMLCGLSDKDLSNLLAVNSELSERKFELKVSKVRFVGHPTLMHHPTSIRPIMATFQTSVKVFHIVFCLHARASHSIVKCFYDLSKRMGIGLRHEEYRCGYVSRQMKDIISMLDEFQSQMEEDYEEENYLNLCSDILSKSSLAQLMKKVYDDVCKTGFVKLRVNNWVQISFCLPQKIHSMPFRVPPHLVEPENIHRCLEAIRPYHAILLLVDREELASSFRLDASSTIPRILQIYSPLKSLQTIAADGDLSLSQVVEVASHLVYWALATVIYPICEANVYVIAPDAPITSMELEEAFMDCFPGLSLTQTLGDFSLPMPIGERVNPMLGGCYLQAQVVQLVCWLLKNHLLIQLHTYIYMMTYLDGQGVEDSMLNGHFSQNLDFDEPMSIRPYEYEEDDDVTVSDSYSETTGDEVPASPIFDRDMTISLTTILNERVVTAEIEINSTDINATTNAQDGEESSACVSGVVAADKFKVTLSELNEAVKRAVAAVKTPVSIQDIKMFSRLSKYFTGEYHLEEIMYMENVRRSQLFLLLDKFRDILVTVEKEDADINLFHADSEPN